MGVVSYFLPFLYMFLAVIRLQNVPAAHGVMRIPGGKPVAIIMAVLGLATTAISSILACLPPDDEPNKVFAVIKLVASGASLSESEPVVSGSAKDVPITAPLPDRNTATGEKLFACFTAYR